MLCNCILSYVLYFVSCRLRGIKGVGGRRIFFIFLLFNVFLVTYFIIVRFFLSFVFFCDISGLFSFFVIV